MNSDKPILRLLDEFLANQQIRENSRKRYRECLHVFIQWLTCNADVKNPLRSDIIRYKQHLIESGRASMTVDNYLVSVRQFFKYLEDSGIYDNIAVGVHVPKKYMGYRKGYLKPEEVYRLLASINRDTIQGKRDYAIINLMVRTGIRCIEVSRANRLDLFPEENHWIINIQPKGHWEKDTAIGLSGKVSAPIYEYIKELKAGSPTLPLFRNHSYISNDTRITPLTISKFVKKYMRAIAIDSIKLSAHSLRHTAAITALNEGASLYEVQMMLGHRSGETTQIYLRAIEEEKRRTGTAVHRLDNAYELRKNNGKPKDPGISSQLHG